jgi:hypothetical protein
MELAALLADEPFSDQPTSVSPVVGAFLRVYNDRVDDRRRQDLRAYAAAVVGSRAEPAIEKTRARRCLQWGAAHEAAWRPGRLSKLFRRRRRWLELAGAYAGAAAWAVRRTDAVHESALRFLDELIAIGDPEAWARVQLPLDPRVRCTA